MTKRKTRKPVIGEAFDSHQRNTAENVQAYVDELRYYAPRRFAKLIAEGEAFISGNDDISFVDEWMHVCDVTLTVWAWERARHDYIAFGQLPYSGSIGFFIDVESAQNDADLQISDLSEMPRGFSGLAVLVNDHGNVTAYQCSRGKRRELFAVV